MLLRSGAIAAAALLAARGGSATLAAVLVGAGAILTVASLISPLIAHGLDRAAAVVGSGAASAIAIVGVGAVDLFVGVPGRVISRLRGRSPLTGRSLTPSTTWRIRTVVAPGQPDRAWGPDVPGRAPERRSGAPRLARWVGLVGILVVADLLAGTMVPEPALPAWVQPVETLSGPVEPGVPGVPLTSPAARASVPALADAPWGATCLEEFSQLRYEYVQFIVRRLVDAAGSCVRVHDGMRAGLTAPEKDAPDVWLLGASAAFGEGQRDDHTIGSELVRQGIAAGHPVNVRNYAVPGLTSYQEALLLEQLLAVHPRPDLVILYDGMNDVAAQLASPTEQATWLPTTIRRSQTPANTKSFWTRWRDASLSVRVWEWFTGGRAEAAPSAGVGPTSDPAEIASLTVGTYARGVDLARQVADRHDVPIRVVFQATKAARDHEVVRRVTAALPNDVLDLSGALDGSESAIYIDSVHPNERGARLVAAEIRRRLVGTVVFGTGS